MYEKGVPIEYGDCVMLDDNLLYRSDWFRLLADVNRHRSGTLAKLGKETPADKKPRGIIVKRPDFLYYILGCKMQVPRYYFIESILLRDVGSLYKGCKTRPINS